MATEAMRERRRYRTLTESGRVVRRLVVPHGKLPIEGFIRRGVMDCPNCTDYGDYGAKHGPFGCEECGHTGKRRYREWEPFDYEEFTTVLISATQGMDDLDKAVMAYPAATQRTEAPE